MADEVMVDKVAVAWCQDIRKLLRLATRNDVATESAGDGAEQRQRLNRALARIERIGSPTHLMTLHEQAATATQQSRFDDADELLDTLEARLTTAERSAEAGKEIEAATGRGNVRFRALRMQWGQAKQRAQSELERLVAMIVSSPEVVCDPRAEQIEARAGELLGQFPDFGTDLEDALSRSEQAADEDARGAAQQDALAAAKRYLAVVNKHPLLKQLDSNYFGKVSVYEELVGTLSHLESALGKTA